MKLLISRGIDAVFEMEPTEQKHRLCVRSTSLLASRVITAHHRAEGSVLAEPLCAGSRFTWIRLVRVACRRQRRGGSSAGGADCLTAVQSASITADRRRSRLSAPKIAKVARASRA